MVLTDFWVLGTTRLSATIRATAIQGALLAALAPALYPTMSPHILGLALGTLVVKALVLPMLPARAIREAAVRREIEPLVGYTASLLLGAVAVALSFGIAPRIPLPATPSSAARPRGPLDGHHRAHRPDHAEQGADPGRGLPGARKRHLRLRPEPGRAVAASLVEMGVLLDIFVGVFIMGIVVFHINREFDSLDSARLTELKD